MAWLLADPRTPDLAAQLYRVGLFERVGFTVFDQNWYAGHQLPGYSLLFPPLGSLLGARALAALCVPISTVLFLDLTSPEYGRGASWAAAAFAIAAAGDLWLGRLAFALGACLALGAGVAFKRGHPLWAALLAALAAAGSPVAGLLLGLAGLTVSLHQRSPRAVLALAVPAAAVVLPVAALFPEGGTEPYPIVSFAATAAVVLAFLAALPRREGLLRLGAAIYLLACLACLAIPSPIGSNIERYGVLLAGPLLVCALLAPARRARSGVGVVGAAALALIAVWVLWGPVRETAAVAGSAGTQAAYYEPLERFLDGVPGPVRVEVPLTRSHWEAALLAPHVSLARGWEKQLDERYDGVLLGGHLTAAGYRAWLDREAVAYVALPDVALDPSSAAEGRLIRSGPSYLQPVFTSAHWRVFRVEGATPLASGPGRLTRLGHDSLVLRADRAGTLLVRVHYTPYWTVTAGRGCVGAGPEGFTTVRAAGPGRIEIAARFSLSRAFGSGPSCRR
ncbi:MAG: hypothetical protein ACLQBB_03370 [Solirubrobacteraceae bacterium]